MLNKLHVHSDTSLHFSTCILVWKTNNSHTLYGAAQRNLRQFHAAAAIAITNPAEFVVIPSSNRSHFKPKLEKLSIPFLCIYLHVLVSAKSQFDKKNVNGSSHTEAYTCSLNGIKKCNSLQ